MILEQGLDMKGSRFDIGSYFFDRLFHEGLTGLYNEHGNVHETFFPSSVTIGKVGQLL